MLAGAIRSASQGVKGLGELGSKGSNLVGSAP